MRLSSTDLTLPNFGQQERSAQHPFDRERLPQQQQTALRDSIEEVRFEQLLMQLKSCAEELQTVLSSKGLYQGEIDGVYGPRTQEAIKQLKKQEGNDRLFVN